MHDAIAVRASSSVTVAAVQAQLRFFCNARQFREQIAQEVEHAMVHRPDLIVFPEDIGTGLVGLGTPGLARVPSLRLAMLLASLRNATRVMPLLRQTATSLPWALVTALARRMRAVYVGTFAELAARHRVYIAAGSILLPHEDDDSGRVYNTTYLFGPDGTVLGQADKVNLIDLEGPGGLDLTPGASTNLHLWRTPIGTFAPIICFDAWDRDLVGRLVAEGAQMLLVASANPRPWTNAEAADRAEGMYARVRELRVPGVEAFGVGRLGGLPFEGRSWIVAPDDAARDGVRILPQAQNAAAPEVIAATVELPAPAAQM